MGAELHLRVVELELFDRELHLRMVELELFDWELHLGLVESGLLCAELHFGSVELELLAAELRLMALSRSCLPHNYTYGCQAGVIVTITSLSSPAHASQPQKSRTTSVTLIPVQSRKKVHRKAAPNSSNFIQYNRCLLYTSDAADDTASV